MVALDHDAAVTFDPEASNSEGDYYIKIAPPVVELSSATSGASYTVVEADWNTFIECTNATGCEVTLPAFPTENTQITFRQATGGPINFVVAGGGDPIKGMFGFDLMTGGEGSVVTCKFRDGAWRIWGRLAPVSA